MSDEIPQIPMPAPIEPPGDSTPPPEGGFTRELTPEEKQNALINFMGGQYGEMLQMDNQIVGESTGVRKGKSEEVKQQITQLVQQPLQQPAPPVAPLPPSQPPVPEPVQADPMISKSVDVPQSPPESPDQLTFNFDINEKDILFDKIDKINARLDTLNNKINDIQQVLNKKSTIKKKSVESIKK